MKLLNTALLIFSAFAAASACEEGAVDLVRGTRCRRYAECQNGSWHLKECKLAQVFDPNTQRCASVTEVGSCKDDSKCVEGRAYSHLGSSSLYYRCINGRILIQVCGTQEVFDPNIQYCRVDHSFQQIGLNAAKRKGNKACEEGSKHRDGKSCKDYLECVNGKEVKKTCSDCMNFDDNTLSCRFVFLSPCGSDPTPAPPTTIPTEPTTEPTKPTEPTTEPTKPTEPTTEPTKPTEPTTEPTKPTEPTAEPTEPTTEPTEPTTEPTKPTEPTTEPTEPTTEPTKPTEPTTEPTESTTEPTKPTEPTSTEIPLPCKEGDKVGLVDPDCKAYEECKKGVWVKDACGWFREFDAIKKECEYRWFHTITCAK